MSSRRIVVPMLLLLSVLGTSACAKRARTIDPDARSKVEGTGIEARDLRAVSEQLSTEMLAAPFLAEWKTPPRVAVLPVENRSRFLIDAEIITTMLTDLLIQDFSGRVAILNRDLANEIARERALKRSGQLDGATRGNVAGADFFLEGTVQSLSASSSQAQTDFVVIRFQMTDAETSVVRWSGSYQVKKEGRWGVMYQ